MARTRIPSGKSLYSFYCAVFVAGLMLFSVRPIVAQEWPAHYVKFIVAGSAGSAPDIIARLISNDLSQSLGQQITIENMPGATGNIGTEAAARSASDGYTFLFGQAAPLALNQHVFKSLNFNAQKDFDPVIMVGISPMIIAASPSAKIGSLKDLIAEAKAEPGKLTFATPNSRNIPHLTGELLKIKAGINIVHVGYRNNPQAVADTISGTVQLMIDGLPVIMPQVRNKALVPIAVSSEGRLPGIEDIPAVSEVLPGFKIAGWFAIFAPHGTPGPIVEKLNRATDVVLKKPEILERLRDLGVYPDPANTTPAQLKAFLQAQSDLYGNIVRESGIASD